MWGKCGGVEEVWTDWFERNAGKLKLAAHSSLSAAYSLLQDSLHGFYFAPMLSKDAAACGSCLSVANSSAE